MSFVAGSRIAAALSAALYLAPPLVAQATGPLARQLAGVVAPSEVRLASGRPGPRYWQQRVDYRIAATLDPATERAARPRDDPLRQPLARRAAAISGCFVEQNICAPDSITNQLNQPPLVFLGIGVRLLLPGLRRRPDARVGSRSTARTLKRTGLRHDDAGRSARSRSRRARRSTSTSAGTSTCRPGRRPHGPRRPAVRDRAVVSAHGGLRRRARLEPRAVHRRRRVLPRVRQLRRRRSRCRRATSSPRPASCRIPSRCSPRRSATRLARARTIGHAGRDHHAPTKPATPRAHPPVDAGHAHLALHRRQRPRLRVRRRARTSAGTRAATTAS